MLPLIRDSMDRFDTALADDIAKLDAADAREQGWAESRVTKLREAIADTNARLAAMRSDLAARNDGLAAEVEARIAVLEAQADEAEALGDLLAGKAMTAERNNYLDVKAKRPETQVAHHLGYEIEDVALFDVELLRGRFDTRVPESLRPLGR